MGWTIPLLLPSGEETMVAKRLRDCDVILSFFDLSFSVFCDFVLTRSDLLLEEPGLEVFSIVGGEGA